MKSAKCRASSVRERSGAPNLPEHEFENENMEFFFINSWESEERAEINEKVVKLLEEEGYNFNVLFDYTDEVITNYKIRESL